MGEATLYNQCSTRSKLLHRCTICVMHTRTQAVHFWPELGVARSNSKTECGHQRSARLDPNADPPTTDSAPCPSTPPARYPHKYRQRRTNGRHFNWTLIAVRPSVCHSWEFGSSGGVLVLCFGRICPFEIGRMLQTSLQIVSCRVQSSEPRRTELQILCSLPGVTSTSKLATLPSAAPSFELLLRAFLCP